MLTGLNEAFVIDETTRARLIAEDARSAELIKPFLAGRDIKRYEQPRSDKYLILIARREWIDEKSAMRVMHLSQLKENNLTPIAKPSAAQDKGGKDETGSTIGGRLQDTCDYYEEFEKPKIMLPDIAISGNFIP